jgi:hypothetical protein
VHGQQLHGLAIRRHRPIEPGAGVDLGLEVGEQAGQRRLAVHVDVRGHRVQERPELIPTGTAVELRGRRQLDVQPEGNDDAAGQVEHRLVAVPAEVGELGRQ